MKSLAVYMCVSMVTYRGAGHYDRGPKAPRFVNNVATEPRYVSALYHGCQNVHDMNIVYWL